MEKLIVVLEDSKERMVWLRENFPDAIIKWSTTVDEFFDHLRTSSKDDIRLIILDHDLGSDDLATECQTLTMERGCSATCSLDENGQNGTHAVDGLDSWHEIPVVVWSVNTVEGPRMAARLKKKKFVVVWVPFESSKLPQLHRVIDYLV